MCQSAVWSACDGARTFLSAERGMASASGKTRQRAPGWHRRNCWRIGAGSGQECPRSSEWRRVRWSADIPVRRMWHGVRQCITRQRAPGWHLRNCWRIGAGSGQECPRSGEWRRVQWSADIPVRRAWYGVRKWQNVPAGTGMAPARSLARRRGERTRMFVLQLPSGVVLEKAKMCPPAAGLL